ncbi:hypothetical protein [Flagellimonas ochracea]|uniref:hypothetical protein n=1 Tax=Flagellimonas ochracea TaxID=2696472 RepID=UPI001AA163FD|nr:hypothetical protein [Allomuricauda ochracea]
MKTLQTSFTLYLFGFLCCLSANAQLHFDLEVANKTNEVFGPLDKSKIPHSMLLDYGYDFVDVPNYDGVLRDNNYIVPSVFRDLYNSVVSMRTSLVVPELVDPIALEQDWKSMAKSHAAKFGKKPLTTAITLNGLYYHYSRIRPDALDEGLIQIIDGKKYGDVYKGTNWQNPYETKEVFAITLPRTQISSSTISLLLEDSEWRTNQPTLVESFAVDFGDGGGFQPLELGTTLNHTFAEDGDYVWTFQLQLTDNTFRYCRTPVKITGKAMQQTLTARNPECTEPWEETITASKTYQGVKGVAKLQIAAANECKTISKPLIVVEGFDSGLTGNHPIYGDTDLDYFLREVVDSDSQELQNLITADTEESFDIIYVNWADGTDWLQRNAYALEAVIEWVNSKKEDPTAPNVVLGQSMGGVLVRYALRDMENNNLDHDTSLYISHDAPHQGAHVPPGALYMVRHVLNELITTPIGDVSVAIASGAYPVNEGRKLIDQPAVRQLLINWVDVNYEINNETHKAWQDELNAMGYPQQTWNIALSNGSHCAQPYGIEPGQTLFRLHGTGSTRPFTDVITFITGTGWLVGAALGDIPALLMGFLPGNSKLKTDFQVWAFPGGEEDWLYKGWIQYEKKLLWVAPLMRTITNRTFSIADDNLLLDDFPGGAMPFIGTIDEFDEYESNILATFNLNLEVTPDINFIPVTSALDVGSNNVPLIEEDYLQIYTTENPPPQELAIPFDNFTTTFDISGRNAAHISFNRTNGDWLAQELNTVSTSFDCTFLCNPEAAIQGSKLLCQEELYFVEVPGAVQVQWSSSNPDAAFPTDPNSPATFFTTPPNTYSQPVTITATITSESCGGEPVVLEKVLQVGKPSQPSDLFGPEVVLTGALVSYFGGPAIGADSYQWWLPHPFEKVNQFDLFGDNWQVKETATSYESVQVFTGYAQNDGLVQLMGVNECGVGPARTLYVEHAGGGNGGGGGGVPLQPDTDLDVLSPDSGNGDGLILYPNIATEEVTIALDTLPLLNDDQQPTGIVGVTVYAQMQPIVKKRLAYAYPGVPSVTLDIRDLNQGYYTVAVETTTGLSSKILIVE